MLLIPDCHDGFFDGLWLSKHGTVHLFLRTEREDCFTLILGGVEALSVSDFRAGNIIFEIAVIPPEELALDHMPEVYQVDSVECERARHLLSKSKQERLVLLQFTPAYGACGSFLFKSAEVLNGHVLGT
jgi:hypothetical protein